MEGRSSRVGAGFPRPESGNCFHRRRRGDTETRRRGDAETRRRGDTETRRHGDAETRRRGDTETRRRGDAPALSVSPGSRLERTFQGFETPTESSDSVARVQEESQSPSEHCLRVPHSPRLRVLEPWLCTKVHGGLGRVFKLWCRLGRTK